MYRFFGILAALAVIAACDTGTTSPDPDPLTFQFHAALQGQGAWETIAGVATVVRLEGESQFHAAAEIAGDEPGAVRPWHVHFNTCAEGGGIVGADADYPRLEIGSDGVGTATTTVGVVPDPDASYHVNVHRSEDDMDTIIACGDLVLVAA